MKTGDCIQVRRDDTIIVKENPVPIAHWLYARVLQVNDDGTALVEITHAANVEHGDRTLVPVGQCRTKDDVAALLALAKSTSPDDYAKLVEADPFVNALDRDGKLGARLTEHYQAQLKRLN